jgi:16S rRNA processing protein RimM
MTRSQVTNEAKVRKSGSPQSGEPLSISVGKIRKPHGVMGEVVFEPFPEYAVVLKKGEILLVGKKKDPYTIRSIRKMDQNYLIAFQGLDDCDVVGHLRNQLVYFKPEQLEALPTGKHYPHQVLGMQVIDEQGESVGRLVEVLITGANDVYVVKKEGTDNEILLPAIESVILKVDSDKKVITVRLPIWE